MNHFGQYDNPAEDSGVVAEPVFEARNNGKREINPENALESEVRSFAQDFFETVYSKEEMPADISMLFAVQDELSHIAGSEEEWQEEGRYTPEFREATKIFLDEMLVFCETKKDDIEINKFLGKIHKMFFAFSPNIAAAINLGQYFDFASRATRMGNLQVYLGGNINGEFAGNIGWGYNPDSPNDSLFESYSKNPVSKRLDKLNLMEIIHAELIGAGNAYNYHGGETKMDLLLKKIEQNNDNAFIGYYIEVVKDKFKREYENPSKGIFHWTNDPEDARLAGDLAEEQWDKSIELGNAIIPNRPLKRGEKFAQIAENVVAILNHANIPTKYAQIDFGGDGKKGVDFVDFDKLIDNNRLENADIKDAELLFQHLYRPEMRGRIEKEFDIKLNDLPFHYHFHFLKFLSEKNIDEVENVKLFLDQSQNKEARRNRIKSFLSLEAGQKMSENIFGIGEALNDQEVADAIFAKYAEIVDLTDKIREELGGIFKDDREVFQKDLELISQDLIGRANKLLVDFSNKVKITTKKEDILAKLENYESDLVLTASVYKSLKQSGAKIELEDFKGVTFEGKTANEISRDNELKQMLKIYGDNYGDKYGYGNDLKNKLVNNLKQKIENEGSSIKIYLCKKGDKIIVFNAFEDCGNGKKRGFAYNAIESMSGSSVGKCFLKTSLEMAMADGETIEAECDPRSPMSSYYIEKADFIGTGATDDYQKTGEPALNIEISVANKKYKYRDFERYKAEDIIAEQKNQSNDEDGMVLMFPKFSKESPQLLEETIKLTNQSYIMTRYVISGENAYCAFEKARA